MDQQNLQIVNFDYLNRLDLPVNHNSIFNEFNPNYIEYNNNINCDLTSYLKSIGNFLKKLLLFLLLVVILYFILTTLSHKRDIINKNQVYRQPYINSIHNADSLSLGNSNFDDELIDEINLIKNNKKRLLNEIESSNTNDSSSNNNTDTDIIDNNNSTNLLIENKLMNFIDENFKNISYKGIWNFGNENNNITNNFLIKKMLYDYSSIKDGSFAMSFNTNLDAINYSKRVNYYNNNDNNDNINNPFNPDANIERDNNNENIINNAGFAVIYNNTYKNLTNITSFDNPYHIKPALINKLRINDGYYNEKWVYMIGRINPNELYITEYNYKGLSIYKFNTNTTYTMEKGEIFDSFDRRFKIEANLEIYFYNKYSNNITYFENLNNKSNDNIKNVNLIEEFNKEVNKEKYETNNNNDNDIISIVENLNVDFGMNSMIGKVTLFKNSDINENVNNNNTNTTNSSNTTNLTNNNDSITIYFNSSITNIHDDFNKVKYYSIALTINSIIQIISIFLISKVIDDYTNYSNSVSKLIYIISNIIIFFLISYRFFLLLSYLILFGILSTA